MKIGRIVLGICTTNSYYLYQEDSSDVIFVDPADRGEYLYEKLREKGLNVKAILLTHGHFDHILGAKELSQLSGAEIYALDAEKEVCESEILNLSGNFGQPCTISPDHLLKDGQEITFAGLTAKVIATPGHTKGGCCYYFEEEKVLISGDTLFKESIGRTDFPSGSYGMLVRSVKEKLFVLPEEVTVYPGHGDETSIHYEKRYNPFVQ